jgi:hypothetical protein
VTETPLSQDEKELIILARKALVIPDEQRKRLFRNFEDNIDTYLDAMGFGQISEFQNKNSK